MIFPIKYVSIIGDINVTLKLDNRWSTVTVASLDTFVLWRMNADVIWLKTSGERYQLVTVDYESCEEISNSWAFVVKNLTDLLYSTLDKAFAIILRQDVCIRYLKELVYHFNNLLVTFTELSFHSYCTSRENSVKVPIRKLI